MEDKILKNELIEAIKDNRLMDFIASNYYRFSKEELMKIIKEYDYVVYSSNNEKKFSNIMVELKEAIQDIE